MPVIGNKVKKKSFSALTGAVSGFNMGNEFNSLSQTSILCGTKFQEYPPFQDAPDDLMDGLADTIKNIGGNVLGGIASFVSVLGNNNMFRQILCVLSGGIIQTVAVQYDITRLMKVVVGGLAFQPSMLTEEYETKLKGFIPQKIPNEVLLDAFEVEASREAWMQHNLWMIPLLPVLPSGLPIPIPLITTTSVARHKTHNMDILCNGILQDDGKIEMIYTAGTYIENQNEWGSVKFGISDMAFSGCEIIATYNALLALGEPVLEEPASEQTVVDLIAAYENNGAVLGGLLGSSAYTIEDYFRVRGCDVVTTISQDPATINKIGESSDTIIVYAYNNKNDITAQIHTVSITKEKDGKYSVHNAFNAVQVQNSENSENSENKFIYVEKGGFDTLQDAINAISSDPASIDVIGISKPKIGDFVAPEEHAGGVPS